MAMRTFPRPGRSSRRRPVRIPIASQDSNWGRTVAYGITTAAQIKIAPMMAWVGMPCRRRLIDAGTKERGTSSANAARLTAGPTASSSQAMMTWLSHSWRTHGPP